jgi:predicted dehydrogenase
MIEDFARAVESRGLPACEGREGLRSLALVKAIYAAARREGDGI